MAEEQLTAPPSANTPRNVLWSAVPPAHACLSLSVAICLAELADALFEHEKDVTSKFVQLRHRVWWGSLELPGPRLEGC